MIIAQENMEINFIEAVILIGRHPFVYVFGEKDASCLAFRWNLENKGIIHKKKVDTEFPVKAKLPTMVYNMSLLRAQYQLMGR